MKHQRLSRLVRASGSHVVPPSGNPDGTEDLLDVRLHRIAVEIARLSELHDVRVMIEPCASNVYEVCYLAVPRETAPDIARDAMALVNPLPGLCIECLTPMPDEATTCSVCGRTYELTQAEPAS